MKHKCEGTLPDGAYGEAINSCSEDKDDKLWIDNGEYSSQVNYCPYCGYKSKKQVKVE
jgi:hypothetical protein